MNSTLYLSRASKHSLTALALLGGSTLSVLADESEAAQLRSELAELSAKVAQLEEAHENASKAPQLRAGAGGLRVTSPDQAFDFRVNGLVQIDGRFYTDGDEDSTFDLRRVRPTLRGTLGNNLDFRFTPELAGNVRILDAFGNFNFTENTSLRFGNFKGPVGLERLQGGANLFFNERGFATEFTPARELGFQLETSVSDLVELKAGVFNGNNDGANGAPEINNSGDFSVAGSVYITPFKNSDEELFKGLRVGLAGSYGANSGNASFRIRGPNRLDVARNGNILEDGDAYRINPGLFYSYGPLALLTEYNLSSRELQLAGGDATRYNNSAWTVAGSYVLTGEKNGYGGVVPSNPFTGFGEGGTGAWELALRYTGLQLDSALFGDGLLNAAQAEKANSFGVGVNWYATANYKVLLSFEHTAYDCGQAGGGNRDSDNVLLTRFQVAF